MSAFGDLPESDDLSSVITTPAAARVLPQDAASVRIRANGGECGFTERCPKCRGTGSFTGYSGRVLGRCHACKGVGTRTFKTSAEDRARARANVESRHERAVSAFTEQHAAEVTYLRSRQNWDFAVDLLRKVQQYGSLTEGQLAAVRKAMARDEARTEERKAEAAAREAAAANIDIGKVAAAIETARANGLKRIKLRLGAYVFTPAKDTGRNPGALYVMREDKVADPDHLTKPFITRRTYLGKIVSGKFIRSRECTAEQEVEILRLAADPASAAVAYGRMTGACACCGKELTNAESIARGIGPVCADKFGF